MKEAVSLKLVNRVLVLCACCLVLAGCSSLLVPTGKETTAYQPLALEESVLARYAPVFVVEETSREYNRIGSPVVCRHEDGSVAIAIDTDRPILYEEEQVFWTAKGSYRNLIYRIHFPYVPFSLFPFHLTAGTSSGNIAVVTLDAAGRPLLVSLVQTCGCYLAMIPTSYLDPGAFPPGWDITGQRIYGLRFSGLLDYGDSALPEKKRIVLTIKRGTHRFTDVRLDTNSQNALSAHEHIQRFPMRPMADLEHLPHPAGAISFFETEGPRKGYVRNSIKPLEVLLMSWWAFDPYVGQDKALGPREKTGVVFNTSLKPWARDASDLGDFASFLRYWGWRL